MINAVKFAFQRCALPALLFGAAVIRPSVLSFVYAFCALIGPAFPSIRKNGPLPASTKFYLLFCVIFSLIASVLQLGYQIYELHDTDYARRCTNDTSDVFMWLRQAGFIKIPTEHDTFILLHAGRIVCPEVLALFASLITYIVCNPSSSFGHTAIASSSADAVETSDLTTSDHPNDQLCSKHSKLSPSFAPSIKRVSDVLLTFSIAFLGVIQPSILNAVYFVTFLILVTWWALYTPLKRKTFNIVKYFLILYVGIHFLVLYAYQIEFIQKNFPAAGFIARIFGLTALISTSCTPWYELQLPDHFSWTNYANFALLLVVYHFMVMQYNWTKYGVNSYCKSSQCDCANCDDGSSVHEELLSRSDSDEVAAGVNFPLQRITSEVLDRQKISDIFKASGTKYSVTTKGMQAFLYFILYHCYVVALLTMMTWALLYHSVFGLIFLALSCFLWALRNSRKWTFKLSPEILIYAEFLLVAQYIFSMDVSNELKDIPTFIKMIGFILPESRTQAVVTLCVKSILSLPLFVVLRLHLREDFYNSLSDHDRLKHLTYGTFEDVSTSRTHSGSHTQAPRSKDFTDETGAFEFISHFFVKCWIFVVIICLLANSLINPPVVYTIGFFIFFAVFILNLHVSFAFFRKTAYLFLTILIVYASLVLIVLYSYQFSSAPSLFHNITGLDEDWTDDIGLVNYGSNDNDISFLIIRLILPISLIVVTMLQLKFFHDPWTKLVQMPNNPIVHGTSSEIEGESGQNVLQRMKSNAMDFLDVTWRVLEVHGYRLILLALVVYAVSHFCVINFIIILFVSLAAFFPSLISHISFLLCVYISTVFIAQRVYDLRVTREFINNTSFDGYTNFTCDTFDVRNTTEEFRNMSSWIGFAHNNSTAADVQGMVFIIILLGLQMCVRYRQRHRRALFGIPEPLPGIIFPDVDPKTFDRNIVTCVKCICNYGFYKFGLEISLSMMVIVAWIRMDFVASFLILWLFVFIAYSRSTTRKIWPFFLAYLAVMFPLQYAMAIGLPVDWCIRYPWDLHFFGSEDTWTGLLLGENLSAFLSAANNRMEAHRFASHIIADFFLLIIVASQNVIFRLENAEHPAGSNSSIYKNDNYVLYKENPYYDFIVEQQSFVDFFKVVIFNYGHWITMVAVLSAGLGGTSLFALGYLLLAFIMLWQGNNLYTMNNFQRTIFKWKLLAYYTVVVMFLKIVLQVYGCVFAYYNPDNSYVPCVVRQLLSIVCVDRGCLNNIELLPNKGPYCNLIDAEKETKIGFDTVAFIFILFQLRILNSWFFQRCIIEYRCELIQARRGAVLINQLIEKEMREQNEQQERKLKEIKKRTAFIRKRYELEQRRNSVSAFTPQTYAQAKRLSEMPFPGHASIQTSGGHHMLSPIDEDDPLPAYDLRFMESIPAKRAGDYYMFHYNPDTDDLVEPIETFVPEVTPGAGDFDKLDPAQLIHTAILKDLNLIGTLNAVESAEKIKDEDLRMIAAVAKTQKERDRALEILAQREKLRKAQQEGGSSKQHDNDDEDKEDSFSDKGLHIVDEESEGLGSHHFATGADSSDNQIGNVSSETVVEEEQIKTSADKLWSILLFVFKMFLAVLDYVAAFMNRRSREHRYVSYVLNKEKEKLKSIMDNELYDAKRSTSDLRRLWESYNVHLVTSEADIRRLEVEAHSRWEERNVFARFMTALGNCFSAHTDVMCFFLAVLAHGICAGIITLPLPALVFFWGTLASPRPSKMFWVVMIAYTECIIAVKFVFQFNVYDWNKPDNQLSNDPYLLQYVFGVQKKAYFAFADVALLMVLFFHRYMLRKLGLWKDANVQDTFSDSPSTSFPTSILDSQRVQKATVSATATTSIDTAPEIEEKLEGTESVHDGVLKSLYNNKTMDLEKGESSLRKGANVNTDDQFSSTSKEGLPIVDTELGTDVVLAGESLKDGRESNEESGEKLNVLYNFYHQLLHPKFCYIYDLYPLMFFLDVFCFLIVMFGYSSFGEGGSGDVINDIQANRVPLTFVLMLLVISLLIVIDRGLYLRKAVFCKLIYQLVTVVLLHIWIFCLPSITRKRASANTTAIILYIVKCVYFMISAWQIRNGYPKLCIGNLLTHSYGLLNMVLFKAFMLIPLLFELRTAIDWTWTDTSMPLFDFFNMENFYAVIYNLKCARTFEQSFPAPRGEAKGKVVKYLMGLPMILLLILVIWSPLLAFSMLNQIGLVKTPVNVKLTISVGGFPPIYSAQSVDITEIAQEEVKDKLRQISDTLSQDNKLNAGFEHTRQAVSFIDDHKDRGVIKVNFRPESESIWQISDESLSAMKAYLSAKRPKKMEQWPKLNIHMEFQRERTDKSKEPAIHSNDMEVIITEEMTQQFIDVLEDKKGGNNTVVVPLALPMNVIVPNEGEVTPATAALNLAFDRFANESYTDNIKYHSINESFNNISLSLSTTIGTQDKYWIAQLHIHPKIEERGFVFLPLDKVKYGFHSNLTYVQLVAFVDRVFPSVVTKFVQGGILAMYAAVVLLVGRIIRGIITSGPLDVIINEIPNPDYLLKICLDIYLVREAHDFILEQDLFAKLIFLFRSPSTLIKWTRYKMKSD